MNSMEQAVSNFKPTAEEEKAFKIAMLREIVKSINDYYKIEIGSRDEYINKNRATIDEFIEEAINENISNLNKEKKRLVKIFKAKYDKLSPPKKDE